MISLTKFLEAKVNPDTIDMEWIDNDGAVITADGYEAKIDRVDMSEVPNQLIGKVYYNNGPQDWIWDETGKCLQCKDEHGNPFRPSEKEMLLKNLD